MVRSEDLKRGSGCTAAESPTRRAFIGGCAIAGAGAAALAVGGTTLSAARNASKPKTRLRSRNKSVDVTFAVQRGAVDNLKRAIRGLEAHQPFLLLAYGLLFEQLRREATVSTEFEFKIWLAKQANNDFV